jgi:glycosyltransferase involved in cell wall biosynthesis
MKILMTADALGGVWTYSAALARGLVRDGASVVLACLGPPPSAAQRAELPATGIKLVTLPCRLEWMEDPWDDVVRSADFLVELERETCADLVHLHGYAHAAAPFRAPVVLVAHSCVLSWWRAVLAEEPPPRLETYRRNAAEGLSRASAVVALTRSGARTLAERYGVTDRVHVIPNGADPAAYAPADKHPFILSAGRLWDSGENLRALLEVAGNVEWPVFLAGELTQADAPAPMLPSGVCSLGKLSPGRLARWMSRASIYAAPAYYDPFGISVLQAAFSECALVLGDIPTLRETWGDAAQYVHPDDRHALANTLRELVGDDDQRTMWGRRARARALTYSADRMTRAYTGLYEHLLENARSGRPAVAQSASR